jgi:hypothetical protein
MKNMQLFTVFLLFSVVAVSYTKDRYNNEVDQHKIDDACEKHWVVPFSLYKGVAYNSFSNDCQLQPLSCNIFGKEFSIQDIFLASKLANDNKIRNANIAPLSPVRPNGSTQPFGNYRTDQYLATLAPTKVNINAEQQLVAANVGMAYNFFWDAQESVVGSIGINVPIKSQLHIMDLSFSGGTLLFQNLPAGGDLAQTLLTQFFKDYLDIRDFFDSAVLKSKGLAFYNRQRRTGLGDVSLYCLADWGAYFNYMDALQVGLNVVLPSGNKRKGDTIWEIELGNGGAAQFEGSLTMLFATPSPVFNPAVRLVGQISTPFSALRRIPKLRQQINDADSLQPRVLISEFEDLLVPMQTFRGNYYVDPFSAYDSSVLEFADLAVSSRIRYGSQFLISIGNYFYDVMNLGFRLGIFYDFMHKGSDNITTLCDAPYLFNSSLLEQNTNERFHRLGWNLTYKFDNLVELNVGSQHILAGCNISRLHEFYMSLIAVF